MRNATVYRPLVGLATLEKRHVVQTYRLNCATIMELVAQLEPDLLPAIRHPNAIPPPVQVLSVLHHLTSGSFHVTVGLAAGMSQPMFSNDLRVALCALLKHLASYIRSPQCADLSSVKAAFCRVAHVPHVIGATDATHIALVPPRRSKQVYRNCKNFHSVNEQVVCLADQYISQVTPRFPGSVHDSFILRNSTIPHMMAPLMKDRAWLIGMYPCICGLLSSLHSCPPGLDIPLTSVHTADSCYPNLPWVRTPVRHPTTDAEDCYNEAHGRTRWVIERSFG
ncbi:putative nuclease HARBI1 [Pleurodeles waltl]|uniref:putative nuclease HARBI1 n=1 Tax=Pleurodeles waltl TaxID=8319 RepID=UPI003709B00B